MSPAIFSSDELERANRAGALCTAMDLDLVLEENRVGWRSDLFSGRFRTFDPNRKIHGRCVLPPGYVLVELPPGTPLKKFRKGTANEPPRSAKEFRLAYTYNVPKVLVGLFQVVWGAVTLYRARGNQIDMYGYAAFGLSAAPYVFMSCANIAVALVTPEYPTLYLVYCPAMEGFLEDCDGIVAAIDTGVQRPRTERISADNFETNAFIYLMGYFVTAIAPLAIVGGLTMFKSGDWSTMSERGWMMSWLVIGAASSVVVRTMNTFMFHTSDDSRGINGFRVGDIVVVGSVMTLLCIPAIGGMVTVGRLLGAYGICSRINV